MSASGKVSISQVASSVDALSITYIPPTPAPTTLYTGNFIKTTGSETGITSNFNHILSTTSGSNVFRVTSLGQVNTASTLTVQSGGHIVQAGGQSIYYSYFLIKFEDVITRCSS